jgi:membrane-associated phospholipid phosphatase
MRALPATLLLITTPAAAVAQVQADTVPSATSVAAPPVYHPHVVRWYEVAAVAGGVALLSTLDETVQHEVQENRSQTADDAASFFRQEGEPWYYVGVSLGIVGVGVVTGDAGIRRTGYRTTAAVATSAVAVQLLKVITGRSRPNAGKGAFDFHPFTSPEDSNGVSSGMALPSGHAAAAFAIATSLADDIDSPVADILLYTAATGTAWSRINDDRHWLSDVALGAAIGFTSAKLVSGRWRIFNITPPGFLLDPNGAPALGMSVDF